MINVLLVEQRAPARAALEEALAGAPDLAVLDHTGASAEGHRLLQDVDIVLLGLDLADARSVPAIQEARAAHPHCRVLVLAAGDGHDGHAAVLAAGAAEVLPASSSAATIISAVRRVATAEAPGGSGDGPAPHPAAGATSEPEDTMGVALRRLTPRERQVLQALADGLSDEQIAARLAIRPATVRAAAARILARLGVESRLQALIVAIQHGAVTTGAPGPPVAAGRPRHDGAPDAHHAPVG